MKKLSERAQAILGIIRERTVIDDGVVKQFFVPPDTFCYTVYGEPLKNPIFISLAGDAMIIRALERRGLVQMRPNLGPYACACTEDGILEYERIAQKRRGSC